MKIAIVVFQGTNCEVDTKKACEFFGWEVDFVWQNETFKKKYDIIFIPGGFSYGDYISSGRIAKFCNVIKTLPVGKSLIVGICNGFQILLEAKLLNGALTYNKNNKFISKICDLEFQNEIIKLPIAHNEGNYIADGFDKNSILMKYVYDENGSDYNIAGIYDRKKRIIGLMPHPERAVLDENFLYDGRIFFKFLEDEIKNYY